MGRDEQNVFSLCQPQQHASNQRSLREIERPSGFVSQKTLRFGFATRLRDFDQIDDGYIERQTFCHHLSGRSVHDAERCPQRVMTRNDHIQRTLQRRHIQIAGQSHGHRRVIQRRSRHQLVQDPETLLIVRKRRGLAIGLSRNRHVPGRLATILSHQSQFKQRPLSGRERRQLLSEV